jgi:hypothetical protein
VPFNTFITYASSDYNNNNYHPMLTDYVKRMIFKIIAVASV